MAAFAGNIFPCQINDVSDIFIRFICRSTSNHCLFTHILVREVECGHERIGERGEFVYRQRFGSSGRIDRRCGECLGELSG